MSLKKAPEGIIVKDSSGGFTEHFPNGSRFVCSDYGTIRTAEFHPERKWYEIHFQAKYVEKADGKTTYEACRTCAWRRAWQKPGGYSPIDTGWVRDWTWTPAPSVSGLAQTPAKTVAQMTKEQHPEGRKAELGDM
jgi:hypothetical protein